MVNSTPQQTLDLAIRHHQSGRLSEAEAAYRDVLAADPGCANVLERLGLLLHQSGRGTEAIQMLTRAAELNPTAAEFHSNLGGVLASRHRFEEAIVALRRAIDLRADLPAAHLNLANALKETGRHEDAINSYQRSLALRPENADAWYHLAETLERTGKPDEAIEPYSKAIQLRPNRSEAYNNLGGIHHRRGDLEQAIRLYGQAAALSPSVAEIHNNLSTVLQETGNLKEGLAAARRASSLRPDFPEAHLNLGNALRHCGEPQAAIAEYRQAIALKPACAQAHYNLGGALKDLGDLDGAIACYREAIRLRPDYGEAYANLANVLRDSGELDESIANYRKASELTSLPWVAGNLLYTLHFHPDFDAKRIHEEHVLWNQRFAHPLLSAIRPHENNRSPDRRLRIAYVSCDFHHHPVGRFMLPLLVHHDHKRFEVFCYSDTMRPDRMTDQLKGCSDVWRVTLGMGDDRFAEMVRRDQIDILVDLSMHARTGRMMAFACKPAPVQVSYLAYCSTSGLETMDYRLSDPYLDPAGSDESVYFERTVRLPRTYWCYPAPEVAPAVAPLPALSAGYITFGCLNTYAKVTKPTLLTWSRILRDIPNSRMIVHSREGAHRHRACDLVAAQGVDPNRLEFIGFLPAGGYFQQYNRIDIALDPFPYAGGTTTCDALWMGVPVVSLTGKTAVSRGGLSILSNLGLQELVAADVDRYAQIACSLANDVPRLRELRLTLRNRMQSSAVMDAPGFAKEIESAFRWMWEIWCRRA